MTAADQVDQPDFVSPLKGTKSRESISTATTFSMMSGPPPSISETEASKDEMFEMLKEAESDSPTKVKTKNLIPRAQRNASMSNVSLDSHLSNTSKAAGKKKRIKVLRAAGSVCSGDGSIDPSVMEAMKSGKKKFSMKELKEMGVDLPSQRGRKGGKPQDETSSRRSKSRGRSSGSDGQDEHRRSKSKGRREGDDRSRTRSKSRVRSGDDRDRARSKSRSRSMGHMAGENRDRDRARSKSRSRSMGYRLSSEDRGEGDRRDRTRSKSRPRIASDRARSKSRSRSMSHKQDEDSQAVPIHINVKPAEKSSHRRSIDIPMDSPEKQPRRRTIDILDQEQEDEGEEDPAPAPASPRKTRKEKEEEEEYDESSSEGSLPPIPTQIVVAPEDMEPAPEPEEDQPQISGNSDEMYNKIKDAGITREQFLALAQAGLTISEG